MKGCFYWLHSVPLGTRGSHLSLAWRQDDAGGRRPRTQWPTRQENDALRRADLTSVNPPWKKVTSHAWHSGCVNYKGCLGILQNIFCWFVVLQPSYLHHCGYAALFWQPHVCWRNEAAAQFSFCRLLGGSACGNSDPSGPGLKLDVEVPPKPLLFPQDSQFVPMFHDFAIWIPNCFWIWKSRINIGDPPFLRGNPWFFTHKSHLLPTPTGDLQRGNLHWQGLGRHHGTELLASARGESWASSISRDDHWSTGYP